MKILSIKKINFDKQYITCRSRAIFKVVSLCDGKKQLYQIGNTII